MAVGGPASGTQAFCHGLIFTFKATAQDTVVLEPYYVNEAGQSISKAGNAGGMA